MIENLRKVMEWRRGQPRERLETAHDDYTDPWSSLVYTAMSPMTTDNALGPVMRQLVTRCNLSSKSPKPWEVGVNLPDDELAAILKPLGFQKKRAILFKDICRRFWVVGQPQSYGEVISIKGIGPKVAALYSSEVLNKPAIAIDTHTRRVLEKLDLWVINEQTTRESLYIELNKDEWSMVNESCFHFGRQVCRPKPLCESCLITDCPSR